MIEISDAKRNYNNILYIKNQIDPIARKISGKLDIKTDDRAHLYIECPHSVLRFLLPLLYDKIADVIAINYKYSFFKQNIRTVGLSDSDYELLLGVLISADIDEDKQYIKYKIKDNEKFFIDGDFNFKMKPLKEKWQEIVGYIPLTFSREKLKDFFKYLINEKPKVKVYVDKHNVYDNHFNKLSRTLLIENGHKLRITKEVILSSCKVVELSEKLNDIDEYYLKEFFGDKIFFGSGYFT